MRMNKNVFTVIAALLVVLVLFCMMQSEGFITPYVKAGSVKVNVMSQPGVVTQL